MMIKDFQERYAKRHELAKGWKKEGKRIFGYFCGYAPEELIDAAGIIPVRILGSLDKVTLADSHLQSFICAFGRSCLDQGLKGTYDYLDGMVTSKTCDIMRNMPGIWSRNIEIPFVGYIGAPAKRTKAARGCLIEEFKVLRSKLEEFIGKSIDDDSINRSIETYNESRKLLKELYEIRGEDNSPLSGSDFYHVVRAGFVTPKKEYNKMLSSLKRELISSKSSRDGKVRFLVSGSTFEDVNILKMIEEAGGSIVADDLCIGSRYFWDLAEPASDPIRSLADRYQMRIACPCKHPSEERMERVLEEVKKYRVEGVISIVQKYCDTHLFEYPYMKDVLQKNDIPFLYLETEDRMGEEGQFKTRVQAFIEMLR
ncbi:MAG: hypothetical protein COW04_03070 [Deltaproteobacteria bacterium CG12_big_fil_rev_8_21_14_0_65_43_10]|nr:MAG: hypothetical protein AUK23_05180 [Deltaproteobacteria bacterium CG2_30_43_15]PIQ46272.1 MAG: hypothetical protein COW04_03070 [Deltaproteobacteria bacterium CG12_big_fil_rev_8_21_14_0_65_43_10]PIU85245.1 MAG: hypothetical protein COS67_08885 [Deltaproteobacteria bacterium CG06_land_8_20_14_3_00_44_19]PIX26729.1 MAG: hypothetical protein COZ68_00345 [Deltaproteobacteria bacterium CG_4_8_14_3_um_filter_43_13]PIZ18436.1 MAG: hypothetical protein COY50_15360 [Deltaproteobacteria bacterium C